MWHSGRSSSCFLNCICAWTQIQYVLKNRSEAVIINDSQQYHHHSKRFWFPGWELSSEQVYKLLKNTRLIAISSYASPYSENCLIQVDYGLTDNRTPKNFQSSHLKYMALILPAAFNLPSFKINMFLFS